MKKRTAKKWISALLTTALLLALLPGNAAMAGGETREVTNEAELDLAFAEAEDEMRIVLLNDITLQREDDNALKLTNGSSVTLDLNGFTLSRNCVTDKGAPSYKTRGNAIEISGGSTLVLTGEGVVTGAGSKCRPNDGKNSEGGAVYVKDGTFILESGAIENNAVSYYNANRGGSPDSTGFGGGVYVAGGSSFTMDGGAIRNNTALGYYGGGVYVAAGGSFTMNGGTITENCSSRAGGGVYAAEGATVVVNTPEAIGENYRIDPVSFRPVEISGDALESAVDFAEWNALDGIVTKADLVRTLANADDGETVTLAADVTLGDAPITLDTGKSVTLDLNGFTLNRGCGSNFQTRGYVLAVTNGSTLTLTGNGVLTGGGNKCRPMNANDNSEGGAVYVQDGVFVLESGTIENNRVSYLNGKNSSLTGFGGGVYVAGGGSFVMRGGAIRSNVALGDYGGGVYVADGGSFTQTGGEIADNTAALEGNDLYAAEGATVTISEGEEPTDETPDEPTDEPATEPADETPSEPANETPAEPADETPAEPADETPAEPADETPAEPADETPAEPAEETPAEPADETPAEPADETPAEPANETPAEPADETPAEPADETPAEPVVETPAQSASTPPAASTKGTSTQTRDLSSVIERKFSPTVAARAVVPMQADAPTDAAEAPASEAAPAQAASEPTAAAAVANATAVEAAAEAADEPAADEAREGSPIAAAKAAAAKSPKKFSDAAAPLADQQDDADSPPTPTVVGTLLSAFFHGDGFFGVIGRLLWTWLSGLLTFSVVRAAYTTSI